MGAYKVKIKKSKTRFSFFLFLDPFVSMGCRTTRRLTHSAEWTIEWDGWLANPYRANYGAEWAGATQEPSNKRTLWKDKQLQHSWSVMIRGNQMVSHCCPSSQLLPSSLHSVCSIECTTWKMFQAKTRRIWVP